MLSPDTFQRLRLPDMDDVGQYIRSVPTPVFVGVGAVAAATAYYLATRPATLPSVCDLHMQSVEVPGKDFERRSVLQNGNGHLTHVYDDGRTLYEFFLRGVRISNNGPCLGSRKPKQPYEWMSYREVMERTENLGSAFLHKGHSKTTDPHIGIFSQNRPEWTISELACYTYSLVSVPLYDTLGTEAISYILDKACISTIVCDVADKVNLVLDCTKDRKHNVRTIVLMETPSAELVTRGRQAGIHILSLQEMEAIGKANHHQPVPPQPEDMAVICFTSGTTGDPKGAMLTHGNIVSSATFLELLNSEDILIISLTPCIRPSYNRTTSDDVMLSFLPLAHMFERVVEVQAATLTFFSLRLSESCRHCLFSDSDVHISFLPLAHMFERVTQGVMIVHGASIGFFQGDIRRLTDDLNTLRPTVFPVVPRLLNRMYDKIFGQANTSLKRWLLGFAYRRKEAELMKGIVRRDSIWDRLIFGKVQVQRTGSIKAPATALDMSRIVLVFFNKGLCSCSQFYEGYGQTECTAGCTMNLPGDWSAGHVGAPLPCNSIKLVDVPEMNYLAVNGEGEVCVKGANVFQGYLKDPAKTAETIDAEGWVHTGDIGKWLPNGTLRIVDRKKHIFKLAQGEYIAPEKIETIYLRSDAVAQVFVHGDSLQACLVAVVVPDHDFLSGWTKKTLRLEGSYQELCGREEVKAAILEDMLRLGKEGGLKSFEQARAIHIHSELFSIENGLLTPTLKAKRNCLRQHFRSQIEELYAGITM
uniref:Long-chain-fatty-acid--CoA ligase n=1 Tax=Scophthalmus maximus TaxID=52904 RepID=A0A8D3BNM2_SCOMX